LDSPGLLKKGINTETGFASSVDSPVILEALKLGKEGNTATNATKLATV
jgi:hypothetical protein